MSSTTDRLEKQAKEVTEDLQKMGGTIREAAQEKLGQVGERASEYCEQGRDKVHGVRVRLRAIRPAKTADVRIDRGRQSPGCSVAFGIAAEREMNAWHLPIPFMEESCMKGEEKLPSRIILVSYPKIVFLYPTIVVSLAAAIYLSLVRQPLDTTNTEAIVLSVVFLGVWVTNLVVLAFDFPRTSSLSLFFYSSRWLWGACCCLC